MLSKRQFLALHEQAVLRLRTLKNYNDQLNKKIGINNDISLYYETQSELASITDSTQTIKNLIDKMEENYLDPDTSRKIGSLKQQFRIQEDRRAQLMATVSQVTTTIAFKKEKKHQPPNQTFQPMEMEYGKQRDNRSTNKSSMITECSTEIEEEHQTQVHMDTDFDYEIERKLLQQKREMLGNAHSQICNIRELIDDTSNMVYDQGDKLDIIGDDLFTSYKNMEMTNEELSQANKQHKKVRNKRICLTFFLILLICAGAAFFFFIV